MSAEGRALKLSISRWLALLWVLVCGSIIVFQVLCRALHFSSLRLPPVGEEVLGKILAAGTRSMLTSFHAIPYTVLPLVVFFALLAFWPSLCVVRVEKRLELQTIWHVVLWAALALNQTVFDINFVVSRFIWLTGPLVLGLLWWRSRGGSRNYLELWSAIAWVALVVAVAATCPTALDGLAIVLWGALVLGLLLRAAGRLGFLELLLVLAFGAPAVQVVTASVDLVAVLAIVLWTWGGLLALKMLGKRLHWGWRVAAVPVLLLLGLDSAWKVTPRLARHGGKLIGEGLAYSFCEMPDRERIFAAVPGCGNDHPKCEDGVIAEYDSRDLSLASRHRVFDDQFYGRLEQIVCVEDEVLVGMCCTKGSGMEDDEATISWSPSSPESYQRHDPEATARRLVFDKANNAIFYVGDQVARVDRDTGESSGELQRSLLEAAARKGTNYPGQKRLFMAESGALFPERGRIYIAEFGRGSRVFEVDLDSLEVVATLVTHNGGVIAATVDRDYGHLWVAGLYGLEIYDLNTGELLDRRRTGTLPRAPVIDTRRDLVFVPTTVEGRITVFHRTSFRRLGQIPIGLETRNCFLTEDGRWFLASAAREHFVWDASELASRFLPPSGTVTDVEPGSGG